MGESEDKRSYREKLSKDESNFLMESPEAGDLCPSEEEGNRNNNPTGVRRQGIGQGYEKDKYSN